MSPPQLLFEPPNARLDFRRYDDALPRQREHGVDEAARGSVDANLGDPTPPRVHDSKQLFDDRGLDTVVNSRSGCRVEANAEIAAEDVADRDQDREARLDFTGLDTSEMAVVDAGRNGELSNR